MSTLRNALLLGAALSLAPAFAAQPPGKGDSKPKTSASAAKKAQAKPNSGKKPVKKAAAGKQEPQTPGPLADFGKATDASPDVVHVANWVSHTRNNKKKAFVLIDKKAAQLYVFDPQGKLKSSTPILLGKAVGDHSVPGIGNKPFSQIKEDEKTTPAGRFLVHPGRNTRGEDILWIDYNAAVSMHRLRKVSAKEQRADRMATPEATDNRISYGCVNVPPRFYNSVLKPTVMKQGAFVYVLPETKTPQQQFGSFDVPRTAGAARTSRPA
ncbi:L,D-transpeptidase [Caenimonas sedimenti]|uniref:L,D-transpeptidase n=1 Tax=Caenimonas sedimenti TaxID=2596921 RepID=A0A562ZW74_9BURK|nr:L,D-transpeptidase [Caenimonas sedimenti]TWO72840.1 L,D-transpeptidase [Caenimonas sedimenti]